MRLMLIVLLSLFCGLAQAQYQGDDVYDPFADYSEFEENSQEEADINFFRNGRFFNVALLMGGRMFSGDMTNFVDPAPSPGLALTYFFDLRLALQFSYTFSQHILGPIATDGTQGIPFIEGNISTTSLAFDLKYYFNTANVTRGLADLNPYILAGFSQTVRNFSLVNANVLTKDDGGGINFGGGIEIPVARNEFFIGLQLVYTYVNFSTENQPLPTTPVVRLAGDMINFHLIFGLNFL